MPVSATLHQDGSQERPASLTSTTSSSGSSRDSRSVMEEPTGPEAAAQNGHGPNSNNNSSGWLHAKGPLSPLSSRAAGGTQHKLSYLGRVVREIVETERMYVQDLRSIVEDYLLKIIETPGLLKAEQVSALFGNIESIYALNSQLLRDLDSCNSDPVAVASCFVERSQEFDIYTQYCNNYPNSVAALTECMRDKQQAKFFRERQELLQHSLPLGSYLLKPVQRILKYHLLLQEIAKHFDKEEDGFEVVEEAIDTMTCVAWYINDMKRRHEHAVRLQEIQSLLINWKGPDLTIYGELVLEGTFRVHRVRNERTFFLFDKTLLITKKRGDHFIYKGHIPCSSLMLIESTRDSLCFTVTHYKHSKQQYNIQAKTAEEKRSWTHHIKRLILENHHATIPQKAKEAILEMDSYYPSRYRRSPERLKKAWSSQDEVSTHARQGRRQSEPTRHLFRQLSDKVVVSAARAAGMKHAGSAGALLDFGRPPQARGLHPEAEGAAGEEEEEEEEEEEVVEEEEEEEEEEQAFPVSLEDLAGHGGSRQGARPTPPGSEEEEEEEEEEESLAVAEQGKGRRESEGSKNCRRPSSRSPTSAGKRMSFESISSLPEVEADPGPGADQDVFAVMEGPGTEEMPSDTEPPEVPEIDLDTHQDLLGMDHPVDLEDFVVAENTEDLKALSSEEEEEEVVGAAPEPESLLPPSVLDQASVIADRFVSSFTRCSSVTPEDGNGKCSGFGTPRLVSLEGSEKGLARWGSTTDSLGSQAAPEVGIAVGVATESGFSASETESPNAGCPVEPDRSSCKKESALSTRDRLLLDKIKSYYENAEHHDAGFSVRRRESLSYIPKGLVRNSVSRINNLPGPDPKPAAPAGYKRQGGSRVASWALFDLPGLKQAGAEDPAPVTDAEFRPSSEVMKMWERMESAERSPRQGPGQGQANGFDLQEPLFILEEHELGAITEESAVASPESASPTEQRSQARLARELKELVKELSSGAQGELVTPLHPRIVQLSHVMDSHVSERVKNKVYQLARQYSLRIKSIKSVAARPPLQWESAAPGTDGRSPTIPCLQEEAAELSDGRGQRKPVLSLFSSEPLGAQAHSPPKPSSAGETSPRRFSFSPSSGSPSTTSPGARLSSRSPLSSFDTETFHWPDVRELRSKYAHDEAVQAEASRPRAPPVGRSRSVPENMVEPPVSGRVGRCSSLRTRRSRTGGEDAQPPPPGPQNESRLNGGEVLCVTADLTLDNNQRVIVLEKRPLPSPTAGPEEEGRAQGPSSPRAEEGQGRDSQLKGRGPRDPADPSKQGRVRNLREKFQALNSVG
ncbi:PREDICTED: pleckstrin homology domain-containing family G member 3 isoform X1 [Chinchilla lanigera]|uniref:pleckstrin homology domain-containing family G member 3 isoform X1 n=1 Tax=Chinchilla lanigera TaxID=34839 RepID=UPI00069658EF|nr:PREDICTED: pleckstrin homology domain-containing family G member 3 isoform X1 [Chinchilla lanigera]XP_013377412.1 PREDICTED: pleckstrin homology domain-containing family G member 3 isoform X1 [Chinchilla lanigera]XP_013377413.1 PREDICTED: pleckstrin homology domain-containing family G member 3 isoform X1 [Chinchilla lanigera]XP_013377414.1 PREDICTED: pleckstrin homology domain-containing family G member 3 isoform X1 [Chinchilla lanigera]XP_013377415.1 PREDICTED: pleckstrin homology domain-co